LHIFGLRTGVVYLENNDYYCAILSIVSVIIKSVQPMKLRQTHLWLLLLFSVLLLPNVRGQGNPTRRIDNEVFFRSNFTTDVPVLLNANDPPGLTSTGLNRWIVNSTYRGTGGVITPPQTNAGVSFPNRDYLHVHFVPDTARGAGVNLGTPTNTTVLLAPTRLNPFTGINPTFCTRHYTNLRLTFFWACQGSDNSYGQVVFRDTRGWQVLTDLDGNEIRLHKNPNWTKVTYELPIDDSRWVDNLEIGFRWVNPGGETGNTLGLCIDDVEFTGTLEYPSNFAIPFPEIQFTHHTRKHLLCLEQDSLILRMPPMVERNEGDTPIAQVCEDFSVFLDRSDEFGNFSAPLRFTVGDFNDATFPPQGLNFNPLTLRLFQFTAGAGCFKFRWVRVRARDGFEQVIGDESECIAIQDCRIVTRDVPESKFSTNPSGGPPIRNRGLCAGDHVDIPYTVDMLGFETNNQFVLMISDSTGDDGWKEIGATFDPAPFQTNGGFPLPIGPFLGRIRGQVPVDLPPGSNYFLRVQSTNPAVLGVKIGPYTVNQCNIKLNNYDTLKVCVKENDTVAVDLPFEVNAFGQNVTFNRGNNFTAEVFVVNNPNWSITKLPNGDGDTTRFLRRPPARFPIQPVITGSGDSTFRLVFNPSRLGDNSPLAQQGIFLIQNATYYVRVWASSTVPNQPQVASNWTRLEIGSVDDDPPVAQLMRRLIPPAKPAPDPMITRPVFCLGYTNEVEIEIRPVNFFRNSRYKIWFSDATSDTIIATLQNRRLRPVSEPPVLTDRVGIIRVPRDLRLETQEALVNIFIQEEGRDGGDCDGPLSIAIPAELTRCDTLVITDISGNKREPMGDSLCIRSQFFLQYNTNLTLGEGNTMSVDMSTDSTFATSYVTLSEANTRAQAFVFLVSIPEDTQPGCNYYFRIRSTVPADTGRATGPICLKQCDIDLRHTVAVPERLLDLCFADIPDSNFFDLPMRINSWPDKNPKPTYQPGNQFKVQVYSYPLTNPISGRRWTLEVDSLASAEAISDTVVRVHLDKYSAIQTLNRLGQNRPYFLRIAATNSSDTTDIYSNMIYFRYRGTAGEPPRLFDHAGLDIHKNIPERTREFKDFICGNFAYFPYTLQVGIDNFLPSRNTEYLFYITAERERLTPRMLEDRANILGTTPWPPQFLQATGIVSTIVNVHFRAARPSPRRFLTEPPVNPPMNPWAFNLWLFPYNTTQVEDVTPLEEMNVYTGYRFDNTRVTRMNVVGFNQPLNWDQFVAFGLINNPDANFLYVHAVEWGDRFCNTLGSDPIVIPIIREVPPEQVDIIRPNNLCVGQVAILRPQIVQQGLRYNWTILDTASGAIPVSITGALNDTFRVRFTKAGVVKVVLTAANQCGYYAYDTTDIRVDEFSAIEVATDSVRICRGDSIQLGVSGGRRYTWTPSSSSVIDTATSSKPFVYPRTTTVFTVTSGVGACSTQAFVRVRVVEEPAEPSIGRNDTEIFVTEKFETYQWLFSDSSNGKFDTIPGATGQSYVVSQQLGGKGGGWYRVTVTNNNDCDKTNGNSFFITSRNEWDQALNMLNNLDIYPNPYRDHTTIKYGLKENANVKIEVLDLTGRTIAKIADGRQAIGKYEYEYRANSPGIYLVRFMINGSSFTQRIIQID
jgi:hypothetical protein